MRIQHWTGAISIVALALGAMAPAFAATVTNINSTITNSGSCSAVTGCPENYLVNSYSGSGTELINVPPAASFGFTDSFNQTGNVSTGSNLGASATGSGAPWNFQDNILFDTNGGTVQAQASALLTNVTDLQIRIIALNNPATGTPFDVTSPANASALLGGGSVVNIENGWTNFVSGPIDYTATMLNSIAAGDYILQIRGEAVAGSSYSGTITFAPVPLPGTLVLMLSALGLLGVAGARRHGATQDALTAAA
jgi:PEP-CTERM motif-containing protein